MRDVERAMKVITWFYVNADLISNILNEPGNNHSGESSVDDSDEETKQEEIQQVRYFYYLSRQAELTDQKTNSLPPLAPES